MLVDENSRVNDMISMISNGQTMLCMFVPTQHHTYKFTVTAYSKLKNRWAYVHKCTLQQHNTYKVVIKKWENPFKD